MFSHCHYTVILFKAILLLVWENGVFQSQLIMWLWKVEADNSLYKLWWVDRMPQLKNSGSMLRATANSSITGWCYCKCIFDITWSSFWWKSCCVFSSMSWVSGSMFRTDEYFCTSLDVVTGFLTLVQLKLAVLFPLALWQRKCIQTPLLPWHDSFWGLNLQSVKYSV